MRGVLVRLQDDDPSSGPATSVRSTSACRSDSACRWSTSTWRARAGTGDRALVQPWQPGRGVRSASVDVPLEGLVDAVLGRAEPAAVPMDGRALRPRRGRGRRPGGHRRDRAARRPGAAQRRRRGHAQRRGRRSRGGHGARPAGRRRGRRRRADPRGGRPRAQDRGAWRREAPGTARCTCWQWSTTTTRHAVVAEIDLGVVLDLRCAAHRRPSSEDPGDPGRLHSVGAAAVEHEETPMGSPPSHDRSPTYEGRACRAGGGAGRPGAGLRRRHPAEPSTPAGSSGSGPRPRPGGLRRGPELVVVLVVVGVVVLGEPRPGDPGRDRRPLPRRRLQRPGRAGAERHRPQGHPFQLRRVQRHGRGRAHDARADRLRPRQRRGAVRGASPSTSGTAPGRAATRCTRTASRTRTSCAACRSPTPTAGCTFTSIFPACYDGRWPHIHFEVYPDEAAITDATNAIATSQVALPRTSASRSTPRTATRRRWQPVARQPRGRQRLRGRRRRQPARHRDRRRRQRLHGHAGRRRRHEHGTDRAAGPGGGPGWPRRPAAERPDVLIPPAKENQR